MNQIQNHQLSKHENQALQKKANEMRIQVIEMLQKANSGHVGAALGIADIMTFLYLKFMKHDPQNPDWTGRDYFLMSNGHVCPIWYVLLAKTGYFSQKKLNSLRQYKSILQGHPKNTETPGVFNSSGALGHGVSQAIGVAIALKLDKKNNRVYCLTSDGEQQEGALWESILNASKYKLNNLTFILDYNNVQIDGKVEEIMPLPNLKKIYQEAGWNVIEIDGHDFNQISQALIDTEIKNTEKFQKPNIIIAHTISGKGVSFMENNYQWHDWKGSNSEAEQAIMELKSRFASNN